MTPLMCMAVAVYFEARGEPLEGQYAVAQVVANRVEDKRYPDNVCDVVFEPRAFSFTHDGLSDALPANEAADVALQVAQDILSSVEYPISSTHYHAKYVKPYWKNHFDLDLTIGNHIFYTNNTPYK